MVDKKQEKGNRTIIIIFLFVSIVTIIFVFVLMKPKGIISGETVKCIGQHSILYTQLGCHACEIQENMFGENYNLLVVVDCFHEVEKCGNITEVPTWIINETKYTGIQSIGTLKNLTGC